MQHLNTEIAYSNVVHVLTLSNKAMYRENPNWSRRPIFSDNCWQSSLAVVAESANSVFVFPSIKVIGSMRGFLDLVACNSSQLGGWFRVPFAKVLLNLSSQYGAYPGGPSWIKFLKYLMNCKEEHNHVITVHKKCYF